MKTSKEPIDNSEAVERYIILLLGAMDRPIPSTLHIEKELFIFSAYKPEMKEIFQFNESYSKEIREALESPLHFPFAWEIDKGGIKLTEYGKKLFEGFPKPTDEILALKLIRELYDLLSKDELLLIIYTSFPEFEGAKIFDEEKRKELALSMLRKGLITEKRYQELITASNSKANRGDENDKARKDEEKIK